MNARARIAAADCWLFDLDGTLIDSAPDLQAALQHTLATFKLPPTDFALIRGFVGAGARAAIERALRFLGEDVDAAPVDEMLAAFLAHYGANSTAHSVVYPGVIECLEALHARGHGLACVTNKHEGLAQAVLDGFSLSHWLPVVIGGDTLPVRKPDPQPLAEACRRLGRPLASAVMVGDSITDTDAGRNAGVPVVAVTYGYRGELTPEELRADLLVESLEALL